jgi:hypothetical protein
MKNSVDVVEIDRSAITVEGSVIRCGGKFLYEIQPGEEYTKLMSGMGGVIIHRGIKAQWVKLENGIPVETDLTPLDAQWDGLSAKPGAEQ